MSDKEDSGIARRKFMAKAAAVGAAGLAGCSNPQNPSESTTTEYDNKSTDTQGTEQSPTTQEAYDDQNELPAEQDFEQRMLDNSYSFIEITPENINSEKITEERSSADDTTIYGNMIKDFDNFLNNKMDPYDNAFFCYSGSDGNLIFKDIAQSESAETVSDTGKFGYSAGGSKEAIERFLDGNISGVEDASDNFPEDLLEAASN